MNKLLAKLLPISLLVLIVGLLAWRAMPNSAIKKLPTSSSATLTANLSTTPEWPLAEGPTALKIDINNADGTAADLMRHHARRVHSLIVSDDFSVFGHIHPEDFSTGSEPRQTIDHAAMGHSMPMDMSEKKNGSNSDEAATSQANGHALRFRFPKVGKYLLGVDVMSMDAKLSQIWQLKVVSEKSSKTLANKPKPDLNLKQRCFIGYPETGPDRYVEPVMFADAEVACGYATGQSADNGSYEITLSNTPELIRADESFKLSFTISKNGAELTDLQPYLAAALHLAIVPESFDNIFHHHGVPDFGPDLSDNNSDAGEKADAKKMMSPTQQAMHHAGHGEPLPENFGPRLTSEPLTLATAGNYWIFAQFKHRGHIVFSRFPIKVAPGFADADAKKLSFTISEQQLSPSSASIQQGDNVILQISSDVAGDFHLTGYELEQALQPDKKVEMRFTAAHSGMFGIELHPADNPDADIPLGSLQVQPR